MKNKYLTEYVPKNETFLVSYKKIRNKQSFQDYIVCYDEAINILLEPILEKKKSDAHDDMVLIPVLYLLRHTIELEFKKLLYILYARFDNKIQIDNGHNLNIIFDSCLKFFIEIDFLAEFKIKFQESRALINFFTYYDSTGATFRYPTDLKLKLHGFHEKQQYIKIELLYKDYKELANFTLFLEQCLEEEFGTIIS
ncbi:MAG: hypothetical protein H6621_06535 [Halobacteriovoraceae bacterium]|nr:hypothetical protein [Halobacteriovoraceae bacterium]